MMNRFSSAGAFVPSMTSFAGMEGSSQKHYTWNWETNSHNLQNHAFFPCTPLLDCPPTLVPANGFHFFSPPPPPEYPMGLVKRDDGGSGCGRIGLNLGHRTYFLSGDAPAVDRLLARSRGMHSLSSHQPRCKAEGCKTDLSGAKHYHRRHKVCEIHSKATVVAVGGLQQRFCQQCSRFHVLAEFDEAKRSCRKRLADHNRRRRKPPLPPTITSPSMNTNTDASEKAKQAQKTTGNYDTTCPANPSNKVEGQQCQNKANLLMNAPALSLGGAAAEGSTGSQHPSVTVAEKKVSHQLHQSSSCSSSPSPFSNTYFHHPKLFSSGSHEHSQISLFHLGQALFEVDYM
ncbi:hypothetical protein OPV22_024902 [Ensete ventricosum]|uniref:SBP-type domain-containing protein n=1 Tax=Ensete ventricosum TaxID=4639 RepID=A0AAV8QBG0_ENSVE|nr:hypothetical protein OPV22_024902 [Ensete ventricosum]